MKAIWNGQIIAQSNDTVMVEGNHYFPKDSLNNEYFMSSDHTSVCGWKGTASYFSVCVDGKINKDAAWFYASPKASAKEIEDKVAFWRGVEVAD